jgi:hypothetical protein
MLQQSIRQMPNSAEAYYELGLAEEATYQFAQADKHFLKATELAPDELGYRAHYSEFRSVVAKSETSVN